MVFLYLCWVLFLFVLICLQIVHSEWMDVFFCDYYCEDCQEFWLLGSVRMTIFCFVFVLSTGILKFNEIELEKLNYKLKRLGFYLVLHFGSSSGFDSLQSSLCKIESGQFSFFGGTTLLVLELDFYFLFWYVTYFCWYIRNLSIRKRELGLAPRNLIKRSGREGSNKKTCH